MTPREQATVALHPAAETVVGFGPFSFDRGNGLLSKGGEELPLPPRALAVLSVLVERAGRVVGKQELLRVAWNGAYVTETSLSEAVSLLRQTLGDDSQRPLYIQTVHRRGYRFIAPLLVLDTGRSAPGPGRESAARPAAVAGPVPIPPSGAASPQDRTDMAPGVAAPIDAARSTPPHATRDPSLHDAASRSAAAARLRGARPAALALGAVTLALAALAGGFLAGRETPRPATPTALTRFAFAPRAGWKLLGYRPSLAVSPDGRLVVFTAFDGKERKALFVRELANLESRELPGTDGAHAPFFSPDGRAVAYFADGELRRVSLAGGPPTTIAPAIEEGGSWGEDGTIVFSAGRPASLFSVPATGGEPRRLTTPDPARGEVQHWWPQLLPGGDAVLFTTWSTTLADARVEWLSLRTRERRTVVVGGASARFAAGRLLWARPDGSVVAAPFDPRSARLLAAPTALVANVVPHLFHAFAQLAVGGDTLVYLPGSAKPIGQRRLARLDGDVEKPLATPARFYRNLKTGPDGRLAATLLANDRSDVWLVDPAAGALSRLTFDAFNIEPAWTADGSRVAYASNRLGPFNVFWRRSDGSAPAERLLASDHHQHPTSFSADGRELMIGDVAPDTGFDLWVVDLGTRRARPLLRTPANEIYAIWSRDSRWFVYTSDESGQWEVLARSYPDLGGRWQLSTDGGFDPFWSANGRTVYFHRAGEVWAVDVAPEGRELHPAAARRVTRRDDLALAAAAPGGGLYAILEQRPEGSEGSAPDVRVVVGWQTTVPEPH